MSPLLSSPGDRGQRDQEHLRGSGSSTQPSVEEGVSVPMARAMDKTQPPWRGIPHGHGEVPL